MTTFGPEPPPRNPAAAARESARFYRRVMIWHHVLVQVRAALDGVLECLRIAGVVLVVLELLGLHEAGLWLPLALILAPQLLGLAVLLLVLLRRRWIRRRVDAAVD